LTVIGPASEEKSAALADGSLASDSIIDRYGENGSRGQIYRRAFDIQTPAGLIVYAVFGKTTRRHVVDRRAGQVRPDPDNVAHQCFGACGAVAEREWDDDPYRDQGRHRAESDQVAISLCLFNFHFFRVSYGFSSNRP
jgi:hypothetical protein